MSVLAGILQGVSEVIAKIQLCPGEDSTHQKGEQVLNGHTSAKSSGLEMTEPVSGTQLSLLQCPRQLLEPLPRPGR
jgi:hypothetical protein